ncbi:MAG: hypothetical protein PHQ75_05360 [Thermoguttaceae bacterium]|nr:hypothetical protein [Thermoguttaceae bacterium]
MSSKYALTCQCGQRHPVETCQAGREITCQCGKIISIPTLLKIKKLPLWSEAQSDEPAKQERDMSDTQGTATLSGASSELREQKIPVLAGNRLGVFIVGIILTLVFAFWFWSISSHKPIPLHVFYKQTLFANGDNVVRRNSSPVSESDYDFYLQNDPVTHQTYIINDIFIDKGMAPTAAFIYFDVLKDLQLSENFYDNFEEIQHNYKIKKGAILLATIFSAILCVVPWFMPRRQKTVGYIRGAQWTK